MPAAGVNFFGLAPWHLRRARRIEKPPWSVAGVQVQVISQFRIGTASHALRRSGNSRYLLENPARRLHSTPETRPTRLFPAATPPRPWLRSAGRTAAQRFRPNNT